MPGLCVCVCMGVLCVCVCVHGGGGVLCVCVCRCQQDYNQREQLIKGGEDGMNRLCGLTLFMGELFLNVTVSQLCSVFSCA